MKSMARSVIWLAVMLGLKSPYPALHAQQHNGKLLLVPPCKPGTSCHKQKRIPQHWLLGCSTRAYAALVRGKL